jgi:hypothetical protein
LKKLKKVLKELLISIMRNMLKSYWKSWCNFNLASAFLFYMFKKKDSNAMKYGEGTLLNLLGHYKICFFKYFSCAEICKKIMCICITEKIIKWYKKKSIGYFLFFIFGLLSIFVYTEVISSGKISDAKHYFEFYENILENGYINFLVSQCKRKSSKRIW